ncbi:MAG: 2-C-methyl-D-erythritol 2,4-cyclodiphosphate synthase [Bacteroidales bacterium]
MQFPFRIGYGYDVHALVEDKAFYLGGVHVPHYKGALGHSDADVLIHAICDALLGAANLGDIGKHFPDNDATYKNIDSKILLQKVGILLFEQKYAIGNIDATIRLQRPKIANYIPLMQNSLAECLHIKPESISIKATTTENLGFEGREEGVSASAICLIYRIEE